MRHRWFLILAWLAAGLYALGFTAQHYGLTELAWTQARHWLSLRSLLARPFAPDKPQIRSDDGGRVLVLLARTGEGPARDRDLEVDFGQELTLVAAVRSGGQWYADGAPLEISGQAIPAAQIRPLTELPGLEQVWWIKVEPSRTRYANRDANPGWWDHIGYREFVADSRLVRSLGPAASSPPALPGAWPADLTPVKLPGVEWDGAPVGTMRFKVALEFADHLLATPGAEAEAKAGTLPGVRRLARRGGSGVPALDQALARAGLPYIWGSAELAGRGHPESHQAELAIGADCADLIVWGWRGAGAGDLAYSSTIGLINGYAGSSRAVRPAGLAHGVYTDAEGRPIRLGPGGVQVGAALMWYNDRRGRGHTVMLAADRGAGSGGREPDGWLGEDDLVFHTSWNATQLARLGSVARGRLPRMVLNQPGQPVTELTAEPAANPATQSPQEIGLATS